MIGVESRVAPLKYAHAVVGSAIMGLLAAAGCNWARPVTYPIPPGVSASFPASQREQSEQYAKTFCSVLSNEFDQDGWKACNTYVSMPAAHAAQALDPIPTNWILLRLGGFGAQCLADRLTAFEDAGQHLESVHRIKQLHVDLGAFESSEQNAARIRDFVAKHPASTRFIVVAHSKGAADTMVALTTYPNELKPIKAVISVAGAVGGSWLVDKLEELNESVLRELTLPTCIPARTLGAPNAIDSMRRQVRQEFLAAHEQLSTPAFSLSAVSTEEGTSKILKGLWKRILPHALEQDSHIVEREAIVPGGTFLGRALGDHWAVAMPFDPNPKVSAKALKVIDQNKFPRAALIEAAVRMVLASPKVRME